MGPQHESLADDVDRTRFDQRCRTWLEAMASGDEAALSSFYEATVSRAYGVVLRIVNDEALTEDIVTDVYYQVWQKAKRYAPDRGRPITWLLTICRNRALDEYRRRSTRQRTAQSAAALDVSEDVQGPDELLEAVEEGHVLHTVLADMSPEQRQLIALAFFKGLTHQQIADYTQTPLGTVKSGIRRALQTMETKLPKEVAVSG